jgi:hypothetical protein
MVDHDQEPSIPGATPLRFGEILAASTMMTEFASLPLECWPGYRHSVQRSDHAHSRGSGLSGRSFMRVLLRFVKITVATLAAVVTRRRSA